MCQEAHWLAGSLFAFVWQVLTRHTAGLGMANVWVLPDVVVLSANLRPSSQCVAAG